MIGTSSERTKTANNAVFAMGSKLSTEQQLPYSECHKRGDKESLFFK